MYLTQDQVQLILNYIQNPNPQAASPDLFIISWKLSLCNDKLDGKKLKFTQ